MMIFYAWCALIGFIVLSIPVAAFLDQRAAAMPANDDEDVAEDGEMLEDGEVLEDGEMLGEGEVLEDGEMLAEGEMLGGDDFGADGGAGFEGAEFESVEGFDAPDFADVEELK